MEIRNYALWVELGELWHPQGFHFPTSLQGNSHYYCAFEGQRGQLKGVEESKRIPGFYQGHIFGFYTNDVLPLNVNDFWYLKGWHSGTLKNANYYRGILKTEHIDLYMQGHTDRRR